MSAPHSDLPRRSLLRGTAWAAPTAIVSVAAPAIAASTPGLNGWVQLATSCSGNQQTLTIDGTGTYPDRGLWVDLAPQTPTPTNAFIIFYFASTLTLSWSAMGANSGWSVPAVDATAPPIAGYTGYITRYTGTWTWVSSARRQVANGQPAFQITPLAGCRDITAYARRSVTIGTQTYAFRRGPVTLDLNQSRSRRSSAPPASDGGGGGASSPARTAVL